MDPTANLYSIKCALVDLKADPSNPNYRADAVDSLRALADWLEKDGFPPDVHHNS